MALAALSLMSFGVLDTGALLLLSPWLPHLVFTREFLAAADGRRVAMRGDEVEIRCANGCATYALSGVVDADARWGSLLRAWGS